ncbi:MAG: pilus assembly protein PilP [Pseudomonadota bacterium]
MNNKYLFLLISLFLVACAENDTSDLIQFVQQEKSFNVGKIPPLPEFVQYKMFTYQADDARDPFVPVVDVEIVTKRGYRGPRPDESRIKEPLENFSLDSLRMMGLLQQQDITWILVKDPDGLLHRVTLGNYLGLNNGKITELYEDSVKITELIPDGKGWQQREAGLAMAEE